MRTLGTTRPNAYPFRVLNKRLLDDLVQAIEGASRTDLIKRASNRGEGWTNSLINVRPVDSSFASFFLDSYLYQRTTDEQGETSDTTISTGEVSGVARGLFTDTDGIERGVACEFILQGADHETPVPSNLVGEDMVVEVVITEIPSSIGADTVSGALVYEGTTPILGFPVPTLGESLMNGDRALAFGDSWLQLPNDTIVNLSGRRALIWRTGDPSAIGSIVEVDVSALDEGGVGIPVPIALLDEDLANLSVVVLGIYTSNQTFPVQTVNDTEGTLMSFSSFIAEGTLGATGLSLPSYSDQWTIPSLSEWTGVNRSGLYLGAFIGRNDHRDSTDGKIASAYRPKVVQGGFEADTDLLLSVENNDQDEVLKVTGRGLQYGVPVNPFLSSEVFTREIDLAVGRWSSLAHQVEHLGVSDAYATTLQSLRAPSFISHQGPHGDIGFRFAHPTELQGGSTPFSDRGMDYLRHGGFFGFRSDSSAYPLQAGPLLSWGFDEGLFDAIHYDTASHPVDGERYSSPSDFFGAYGFDGRATIRVPFNPPHGWDMKKVSFVGAMNFKDGSNPYTGANEFLGLGARLDVLLERFDRTPVQNGLSSSYEILTSASWSDEDFLGVNLGGAIHRHEAKNFKHGFEDRIGGGGIWDGGSSSVSPRYFIAISVRPPAFGASTFILSGLQFEGFSMNLADPDILT